MSSGLIDTPSVPENKPPPWWRRRRPRRWLAIGAIFMLVSAGVYAKLTGNVRHIQVAHEDLGGSRPAKAAPGALNILVVGSDQRGGSDIIMLAHLSADRNDVTVISFPRDSMVRLPACPARQGLPGQKRHLGMINSSFNFGGIGCTWKTIETLTGIHIDHFIKIDFDGFRDMVDAIGGVNLCIPEPIRDRYVGLELPAGLQTLRGEQALGYVRARYGLGDGTDIGRIRRQQEFFAAMVKKAMSGEILANPIRLFGFVNAATRSMTTDPGLTPRVMVDLALTAHGLSSDNTHFVTAPWRYSTTYPGRVEWLAGPAKRLFRLTATDQPPVGFGASHAPPTKSSGARADTGSSIRHAGPATTVTAPSSAEASTPTSPPSIPCTANGPCPQNACAG